VARCFQGYTIEIVGQRLSQIGQSSPQPREIAAGGSNPYDRVVIGPEQRLWLHSGWRGVLIREFSRRIFDDPDIAGAIEPLASSSAAIMLVRLTRSAADWWWTRQLRFLPVTSCAGSPR
jgi:hypothetical protein